MRRADHIPAAGIRGVNPLSGTTAAADAVEDAAATGADAVEDAAATGADAVEDAVATIADAGATVEGAGATVEGAGATRGWLCIPFIKSSIRIGPWVRRSSCGIGFDIGGVFRVVLPFLWR